MESLATATATGERRLPAWLPRPAAWSRRPRPPCASAVSSRPAVAAVSSGAAVAAVSVRELATDGGRNIQLIDRGVVQASAPLSEYAFGRTGFVLQDIGGQQNLTNVAQGQGIRFRDPAALLPEYSAYGVPAAGQRDGVIATLGGARFPFIGSLMARLRSMVTRGGAHNRELANGFSGGGSAAQGHMVDEHLNTALGRRPVNGGGDHVSIDVDALQLQQAPSNEDSRFTVNSNGDAGGSTIVGPEAAGSTQQSGFLDNSLAYLLTLLACAASLSWVPHDVIVQFAGPLYAPVAYGFVCLLVIILAVASCAMIVFDKSPRAKCFAKCAILLSIAIFVVLVTWRARAF